jgi:hypothetical protein
MGGILSLAERFLFLSGFDGAIFTVISSIELND